MVLIMNSTQSKNSAVGETKRLPIVGCVELESGNRVQSVVRRPYVADFLINQCRLNPLELTDDEVLRLLIAARKSLPKSTPVCVSKTSEVLNRTYLNCLKDNSIIRLPENLISHIGKQAFVFLHQAHGYTFTVVIENECLGIANFVRLVDAHFHVDQIGRIQSLERNGPLPKGRSIHAFVSGILFDVSGESKCDHDGFSGVTYNPLTGDQFKTIDSNEVLLTSDDVLFTEGKIKTWYRTFPE